MKQGYGGRRLGSLLWIFCLLALVAGPAGSRAEEETSPEPASQQPASQEQEVDEAQTALTLHGLRVYLDPDTGRLTARPSPEQVETLSGRLRASPTLRTFLSRSTEGLVPFQLSVGGRGVALQGRFQTATVVRRQADGTWELHCVTGAEELDLHEPRQTEVESAER